MPYATRSPHKRALPAAADSQVDTVFEIGGQDSKYISLVAGQVADFQMNKVCAAGTGSFVEEQAARLGIALPDYGSLALSAEHPVELGERCTVFMETAINAALAKGATKSEVAAGLCLSVVRNYLHKVVNAKPVGQRIVLPGRRCLQPRHRGGLPRVCGREPYGQPVVRRFGCRGCSASGCGVPGCARTGAKR